MRKHHLPAQVALTFLFVTLFSYCAKPPVILPNPKLYQISQLTGSRGMGYLDSAEVIYNSKNNPIQLRPRMISTGYPQFLLGYDQQNRLKTVIGAYTADNPYYEMAHKYVRDNTQRIVIDSVFTFGTYDHQTLDILTHYPGGITIKKYTYDNKDRIIKQVISSLPVVSNESTSTITYYYNAAGNAYKINTTVLYTDNTTATSDEFPSYDDKVNPHQLHPIWQFVDIDYSKNNAFTANSYNSFGLPLHITFNTGKYSTSQYFLFSWEDVNIKYGYVH